MLLASGLKLDTNIVDCCWAGTAPAAHVLYSNRLMNWRGQGPHPTAECSALGLPTSPQQPAHICTRVWHPQLTWRVLGRHVGHLAVGVAGGQALRSTLAGSFAELHSRCHRGTVTP